MTVTTSAPNAAPKAEEKVSLTIDGIEISVPKGELIIRAAERVGIQIPRFCDHPLLDPVGACRQCLVDVEGQRKPVASCTVEVTEGMVVRTQLTSGIADKAQQGVMELLLINHPLDCPVCDKGGECPLQNQAMSNGRGDSRFEGVKRTFPKPINISSQVLLDRERCVSCARCTRFSDQIAGDAFITLIERGAEQQVGVSVAKDKPFDSYFSGNTVQICPVGALTGAAYRFRSRPFDLVSSPSACEHCAAGCALRTDHRRGTVLRRMAVDDPNVNEEWNCDKGRWAFAYTHAKDRITSPLVRDEESGELVPASWPEALDIAAQGLLGTRGRAAVLVGGRATVEDAYAYAKFARTVLDTNDIDFRARPHSTEEESFLAAHVAGHGVDLDGSGATYADLQHAPAVLLVGFEPEEESPIVFLRLRKGVRKNGVTVVAIAPYATRSLRKLRGTLLKAAPHTEPEFLDALIDGTASSGLDDTGQRIAAKLREPGSVILVGERLASVPGALSAALRLSRTTGARLAWVPRRAGERGAVEAGALPALLPGGRPGIDPEARAEVAAAWGITSLPTSFGRDTSGIIDAARTGRIAALIVGGVDVDDLPDPASAREALNAVPFVISLEQRPSAVTEHADVVFPVAVVAEKSGTFLNWEGRGRSFDVALRPETQQTIGGALPDVRVLHALADAMDYHLGLPDVATARQELDRLGVWRGERVAIVDSGPRILPQPGKGEAVLATWHQLLDAGRLQDGEPYLAGTARRPVALLSAATAAEIGAVDGGTISVTSDAGTITLPLRVDDLPDRVVWLPTRSAGSTVRRTLRADTGAVVRIAPVEAAVAATTGTVEGAE
jgi:NADH-quinone oxidoreductase subunit G